MSATKQNVLPETFAPAFHDVLVARQGDRVGALVAAAVAKGRTSCIVPFEMFSENVALLLANGFKVVDCPMPFAINGSPVKHTVSWTQVPSPSM